MKYIIVLFFAVMALNLTGQEDTSKNELLNRIQTLESTVKEAGGQIKELKSDNSDLRSTNSELEYQIRLYEVMLGHDSMAMELMRKQVDLADNVLTKNLDGTAIKEESIRDGDNNLVVTLLVILAGLAGYAIAK